MVVWNEWQITKQALSTIKKNSNFPYRLILVDNNSDNKTKSFLKDIEKTQEFGETVVIFNDKNLGWIKGVNKGLEISTNKYICFINNDVLCGVDWLKNMINTMEKISKIGIANPRGNERSENKYIKDLNEYSLKLSRQNKGLYIELDHCSGFCMLIKKEVVDKIGGLDTIYGFGYYEDNDYSYKAKQQGYICAEISDAIVYHYISKSTNKNEEWKKRIIARNKIIFENRWGKQIRSLILILKKDNDILNRVRKGEKIYIIENKYCNANMIKTKHQNLKFIKRNFISFLFPHIYFIYKSKYMSYKKRIDRSVIEY
jgi:GT2 family glycosyltransferase